MLKFYMTIICLIFFNSPVWSTEDTCSTTIKTLAASGKKVSILFKDKQTVKGYITNVKKRDAKTIFHIKRESYSLNLSRDIPLDSVLSITYQESSNKQKGEALFGSSLLGGMIGLGISLHIKDIDAYIHDESHRELNALTVIIGTTFGALAGYTTYQLFFSKDNITINIPCEL